MKYYILIILFIFYVTQVIAGPSITNKLSSYKAKKCNLITYEVINLYFMKCAFYKNMNITEELKEIYINTNSSFIFYDYVDSDDQYYFIALFKKINILTFNSLNTLELEFNTLNVQYKVLPILNKNIDPLSEIKNIVQDLKDYYFSNIKIESTLDKLKRMSEGTLEEFVSLFEKADKGGILFYDIRLVREKKLFHCIDIKLEKEVCVNVITQI